MCRTHLSSIFVTPLSATPHSHLSLHTLACHSTLHLSLHTLACHSTFPPVTLRSHQSLPSVTPTNHSTLPPITPRSHLSLPPASPLSHLHAHRRYPRAHIEAQLKLGIAPRLQLDFVDVRHSGERPLGCFPVPALESLFNRAERRSCESGSGAAE